MNTQSNSPIGIYDSGIGGLTVLKTLIEKLPNEQFIYFADTANLPYGNKTPEQIIEFSHNIISWFQNTVKTKMVIAACHTSSAIALRDVSHGYDIPVIGTIYPMLPTILGTEHKNIGIIATPASVESRIHENIFKAYGFAGKIVSISCPNFVPLIESGDIDVTILDAHVQEYLTKFKQEELDTLIFGCTHYPLIRANIAKFLPEYIKYIDPAEHMTQDVINFLTTHELLNNSHSGQALQFYCSKDTELFAVKLKKILNLSANVQLHSPHAVNKKENPADNKVSNYAFRQNNEDGIEASIA